MPSLSFSSLLPIAALSLVACGGDALPVTPSSDAGGTGKAPVTGVTPQSAQCTAAPTAMPGIDLNAASRLLGVDAGALVWVASADETLHRTSLDGATSASLGVSLRSYRGSYSTLAPLVANDEIWVSDGTSGGGAFAVLSANGATAEARHLAQRWVVPTSWARAGEVAVWSDDTGVWKSDGAAGKQLTSERGTIVGASADTAYLWRDETAYAVPLTGGLAQLFAAVPSATDASLCDGHLGKYGVDQVFVDESARVVFSTWADCLDGSFVHTIRTSGATLPADSFRDAAQHVELAVDDGCAYYLREDAAQTNRTLWSVATARAMQ